jgi:SAM-dependent methyltransferase
MTRTHDAIDALRTEVRRNYGQSALRVLGGSEASACAPGTGCCSDTAVELRDPITRDLYDSVTTASLPEQAVLASLGCGNPTALAELHAGETVLDLGSGGGIDVLLSARRVGPTGRAIGLDMTDEMLALARRNAREAGATNVEFVKGHIESIPLPDASVDVIISNCVVNLSGDKATVLREAFRVLKPGGRFAVSDVVLKHALPAPVQQSVALWVGCIAGALTESEFVTLLAEAGFTDASVEPTRVYDARDAHELLAAAGLDADAHVAALDGQVLSAFVRARKPS